MIPAGFITAVISWAAGDDLRIAQLSAECDALAVAIMKGGQPEVSSASLNGVNFGFVIPNAASMMTNEERFEAYTTALRLLGVLDASTGPVSMTYGSFGSIQR